MATANYSKGSCWGKWDLHVHTPLDHEWINKPDLLNETQRQQFVIDFIKKAKQENLSAIAITDHNFCNNISDSLLDAIRKEGNEKGITVFPGFEITAKDGSGIHLLIIFPENTSCKSIKKVIDQCFPASTELVPSSGHVPVSNKSMDEIKHIIDESSLESIFIFAHADNKNGVLDESTINGERRVQEWKKEYIGIAQIAKSPEQYPKDTFMAKVINKTDPNYSRDITYINASDCRAITKATRKDRTYLGEKFTWIKANPTFEGLKQILYEPQERVRIQPENPEYEIDKPYFDSINIDNEISVYDNENLKLKASDIPLNKNLVTIIGGRGEGKSTLINYHANILNKYENTDKKGKTIFTQSEFFKTKYCKINSEEITDSDKLVFKGSEKDENELEYIFIQQGLLKERSFYTSALSNEIKQMLGIKDPNFSAKLSDTIFELNQEIEATEEWLADTDEFGNLIHQENFQKEIVKRNQILLENLKNSKNKKKIEKFNENLKLISSYKDIIDIAEIISEKIENFVIEIANLIPANVKDFKLPDLVSYKKDILGVRTEKGKLIKDKLKENEALRHELDEAGISGNLDGLLDNATKYQGNIDEAQKYLKIIKTKELSLKDLRKKRSRLGKQIKKEYTRQADEVNNAWTHFLDKHPEDKRTLIKRILLKEDKIAISGEIIFDKKAFYQMLGEAVNKRSYKDLLDLEQQYKIKDIDSWVNYIEKEFNKHFVDLNQKREEFSDLFFSAEQRNKYFRTEAKITYDDRELSKLSAGQRGTTYLRLQLANNAFSVPIVFDQPEDDLDNKFIVDELVDIFKELKKYRQIIIVTHNANLVVNADAEQIIIAKNLDEKITYSSGSLENKEIQTQVCDILEGGKTAFEQRKNKYNIK